MARRSIHPIVREIVAWLRGSEHGSYRDDLRSLINNLAEVIEAKAWGEDFTNARYEFTTREIPFSVDACSSTSDSELAMNREGWTRAWADVTVDGVFIVYRRTRALPDMHPAVTASLGRLRRV